MPRRFQFSLADGLIVTAIAAALTATLATHEAVVSFITLAALLAFVWNRPVIFRLWASTAMGLGGGMLVAMLYRGALDHQCLSDFRMHTEELAGWGAGLLIGGFVAYRSFLSNPPSGPSGE